MATATRHVTLEARRLGIIVRDAFRLR